MDREPVIGRARPDGDLQKERAGNAAPLIALGLALWVFGGLFAVYGPQSNVFGVVLGLAGIAAVVVGIVIRLRA